jgi:hypothetical protein
MKVCASAAYVRFEPAGRSCHDSGVILGNAMLAACAATINGQPGLTVWSLGGANGGSLEDPLQLWSANVTNTTTGHSASFSWDARLRSSAPSLAAAVRHDACQRGRS